MRTISIGGREFKVAPATLADQGEILRIQREALKRAEAEGRFSGAHIDVVWGVASLLLRKTHPDLTAEEFLPLLPAKDVLWQEEMRRLSVAAEMVDDAPGEAVSP